MFAFSYAERSAVVTRMRLAGFPKQTARRREGGGRSRGGGEGTTQSGARAEHTDTAALRVGHSRAEPG